MTDKQEIVVSRIISFEIKDFRAGYMNKFKKNQMILEKPLKIVFGNDEVEMRVGIAPNFNGAHMKAGLQLLQSSEDFKASIQINCARDDMLIYTSPENQTTRNEIIKDKCCSFAIKIPYNVLLESFTTIGPLLLIFQVRDHNNFQINLIILFFNFIDKALKTTAHTGCIKFEAASLGDI
jgi:hypothetical protein